MEQNVAVLIACSTIMIILAMMVLQQNLKQYILDMFIKQAADNNIQRNDMLRMIKWLVSGSKYGEQIIDENIRSFDRASLQKSVWERLRESYSEDDKRNS
ncbi:MAG: hypothetical protein E6X18_02910 [Atopobium minutum]|uniref:hypothetical protein n=1 Tax=Atopobium minutum TaxID=1381 RepID=UPI00290BF94E|nr:hypothetical protein [Atopobium minutum]MDU4969960.1 hypothetical protein [Atopobium minutum]MDU5356786.1 hypothetical protein [Atopobium minutum]